MFFLGPNVKCGLGLAGKLIGLIGQWDSPWLVPRFGNMKLGNGPNMNEWVTMLMIIILVWLLKRNCEEKSLVKILGHGVFGQTSMYGVSLAMC